MNDSMFAKSMFGYNRKQVDSFLMDMSQSFARKEAMMKDRVQQLEASLTEQQKETEGHGEKLTRRESEMTQCEEKLAQCEQELAQCRELLALREQEIARLRESSEMKSRQEQENLLLHAAIGQRIADADRHAEEIVADAQRQAEKILADARVRAEEDLNSALEDIKGRCAVIGQAADLFSEHMGGITEELRKTEDLLYAAVEESKRKLTERMQ